MTTDQTAGAGGLVKKLLFPASASGANDTFVAGSSGNDPASQRHSTGTSSSQNARRSPEHATTATGGRQSLGQYHHHHINNPQPHASTNNPPRFFSSTHPSPGEQRRIHKQSQIPSSPPPLPVQSLAQHDDDTDQIMSHNSHGAGTATASPKSRSIPKMNHDKLENSHSLTPPIAAGPVNFDDDESSSSSSEADHHRPLRTANFHYDIGGSSHHDGDDEKKDDSFDENDTQTDHSDEDANNDNNDMWLPRRQSQEEDGEVTEIHDNRTALDDGEVTEILDNTTSAVRQKRLNRAEMDKPDDDPTEELNQATSTASSPPGEAPRTGGTRKTPLETPPSDYYDNQEDQQSETEGRPSYFPSLYDDPVHNPLVASALKPHSLFRSSSQGNNNNNAVNTSMCSTSDIQSNCSEMGTVVGAPGTMADRFAEVDAMERMARAVAKANFTTTADDFEEGEEDIDQVLAEGDPSCYNYRVFRANDDEHDGASDHQASPINDEYQTPAASKKIDQVTAVSGVDLTARLTEVQNMHSQQKRSDMDDSASSVVDSEIDQLIRRSASASTLPTIIGRSNTSESNSDTVFRRPASTCTGTSNKELLPRSSQKGPGEEQGESRLFVPILATGKNARKQSASDRTDNQKVPHPEEDELDDELSKIDSDTESNSTQRKARPNSSLQKALTRAQQMQADQQQHEELGKQSPADHMERDREESTEMSDTDSPDDNDDAFNASNLASVGSPGLAGAVRRFGSKQTKRSAPVAHSTGLTDAFHFDIDRDNDSGDIFTFESRARYTMSAPTTPQPYKASHGHHNLSQIQETFPTPSGMNPSNTSASSTLRSPGSSARLIADFQQIEANNPETNHAEGRNRFRRSRIAEWGRKIIQSPSSQSLGTGNFQHQGISRQLTDNSLTEGPMTPNRQALAKRPNPLFRACLSFDTTMDQQYDVAYRYDPSKVFALSAHQDVGSGRGHRQHQVQHSRTTSAKTTAFNQAGFCEHAVDGRTQALYGSKSWDIMSGLWSATRGGRTSAEGIHLSTERVAFKDASGRQKPSNNPSNHTLEVMQTPQRIEIEREDALDILSCLVERGVSLHSNDETEIATKTQTTDKLGAKGDTLATADAASLEKEANDETTTEGARDDISGNLALGEESEVLRDSVNAFRKISSEFRGRPVVAEKEVLPDHPSRMAVLDQLMQSHTYALEMKRASLSASAWLRSIGRTEGGRENAGDSRAEDRKITSGQAPGEREVPDKQDKFTSYHGDDPMDLLKLKAMLHQAQMKAQEQDELAQRLNDELSKCRAEIGRLQTASKTAAKQNSSPNRSMLDEELDDDDSTASMSSAKRRGDLPPDDTAFDGGRTSPILPVDEEAEDLNSSLFSNGAAADIVRETDQPVARELVKFKSALSDANAVIRKLHLELQEAKSDASDKEAPVIKVSEEAFSRALADDSQSHQNKSSDSDGDQHSDNRTVNVRMLDGENFVTEWDDITPPLPPPPDHGLHSPIVMALLQQWTDDPALHSSLLAWIDRVTAGEDPSIVPPLTLSSLDHQLRDGFTMHVLPLLLRRPDVHIDVKTRAHRRTAYDIAVSVHNLPASAHTGIRHMESTAADDVTSVYRSDGASTAGSVTHSAVTAHIRNIPSSSDNVYEVGSTAASYADLGSHYDGAGAPQAGIMSALGGALGGLLSRRKNSSSSQFHDGMLMPPGVNAVSSDDLGSAAGAAGEGPMDYPRSPGAPSAPEPVVGDAPTRDDEPYHRLVSAPPGRIGVSFVEFRGHAMVSDVAEDSPLLGWIFPSDVLIALDEVPVSGMRLREIIKLLTARKNRQRAMRVISSHAMNEFTNMNLSGAS